MEHLILNEGSDSAALAKVALKALREARNSKTSNSGSIFVSDGQTDDDGIALGTGTIINGVDGGIQPWVGDTTPPGKPTGITAESHNGAIWVSWDGTLDGGIPADFDHVRFTAVDGSKTVDMGQLRAAGKVTAAELTAGDTVTITAIAYDDAHDAQGKSTPNASTPSDPVTVVVQSAVDAAAVQKAQDDAQTALNQAGQAKSTADTATQTAHGAQADASNAVATANSANDTSKTASSTAQQALAAAQSAQKDTVTQWVPQYAVNQSTADAPTMGWSVDKPSWTAGHYIWMRTVVSYGSGDSEYSNPVLLTGNPGAPGPQGPKGDTGATGPAGINGSDGVSVTAITPYWALGTSAPAQPAVAAPPSPWQSTEPGYSRNQHLYKTSKITYSNGQFAYMPVVMDSSYEYSAAAETAAQDAVQTATNANTTAQTANTAATSAQTSANQAIFAALPSLADRTQANSWLCAIFPTGNGSVQTLPSYSLIASLAASDTKYNADSGNILGGSGLDYHYGLIRTLVSFNADTTWTFTYSHDDGSRIYVDGVVVFENVNYTLNDQVTISFTKGNHIVDIMYSNGWGFYGIWNFSVALSSIATTMYAPAGASVLASALATTQNAANDAKTTANSAASVATQANATAVSANQSATSAQTAANLALANAQEIVVNGLTNGTLDNWSIQDNAVTVDSNGVIHYTANDMSGWHPIIWQTLPATVTRQTNSSRTFRVSVEAKTLDNTKPGSFYMSFWQGSDMEIKVSTLSTSTWTTVSQLFIVPPNTAVDDVLRLGIMGTGTQGSADVAIRNISMKDVTEAQAAQKAADDAQATADTANTTAQNATAIANAAKAAAQGAQTTADGKNKIFSSASEPPHTGIVPGDMWFQLDSNKNVTGIQVWNGSTFTDMVLLGNKLLVASSVGTTQIADNAITTGKISANAITALQIAAQTITGDKLDVGSVAAAIVTSGKFQTATSGARVVMDANGIRAYDAAGNTTFQIEAATGKASLVGGMQTALSGKRISISQSGDVGKVSLLNDDSELTSLTFIDDTANSGYVYTGLYTGQNAQFLQFATLVDTVNHHPDPLQYAASLTSNGRMVIDATYGINVNGTWFAHDEDSLPPNPNVVGGRGTKGFAGGEEYVFDGAGTWVSQTQPVTHIDGGNGQTVDWWCIDGVATIVVTWLHTNVSWASGAIASIPVTFAPPSMVTALFAKQNSARSEDASELVVNPDGSIRWLNLGGMQGTGLMSTSVTYHIK